MTLPAGRIYDQVMADDATTPDDPLTAQFNTERLKRYWKVGQGGARIRWGTDGDLTRCHRLVERAAGAESETFDVWGYCQSLHIELFGVPNPRD